MARFLDNLTEEIKILLEKHPQFLPEFLKSRLENESRSIRETLRRGPAVLQNDTSPDIEKAFNAQFSAFPDDKKDEVASRLAHLLLNTLMESQTLEGNIAKERRGYNPHIETMLRAILQLKNININQDLLFGREIPLEVRKNLEARGMSPESEDNLRSFLESLGVSAATAKASPEALEETYRQTLGPRTTLQK
jgi:hypothetical protein